MNLFHLLIPFTFVTVASAADLKAEQTYPVSGDWMGIGFDSVWEVSDGLLNRVNPQTGEIIKKISMGSPRGITIGDGSVWVPSVSDGKLYKIDPQSNTAGKVIPLKMSGTEGSIAVGGGSVWLGTDEGEQRSVNLTRVDSQTGAVKQTIRLPLAIDAVAYEGGKVWCTSTGNGKLIAVSGTDGKVLKQIDVGPGPRFIATGAGAVWVLDQGNGDVVKIDPQSMTVSSTIHAGVSGGGGDLAFGEGYVWAINGGGKVAQIDPRTNQVVGNFSAGGMGDAIRAGLGSLWISGGTLHRIHLPIQAPPTPKADDPEASEIQH